MKKMKILKLRVVALTLLTLTVLIIYFVWNGIIQRNSMKEIAIQRKFDESSFRVNHFLTTTYKIYFQKIKYFVTNHQLISNFEKRDKSNLKKSLRPYYSILKEEFPYQFHIQFYTSEGEPFLAIGDSLHLGLKGEKNLAKKSSSDFLHLNKYGLYYNVIRKVTSNRKAIGFVEFGVRDIEIIDMTKEKLCAHIFPYYSKEKITTETEQNLKWGILTKNYHFRTGSSHALLSSILEKYPSLPVEKDLCINEKYYRVKNIQNKKSRWRNSPKGILVINEVTKHVKSFQAYLFRALLISMLFIGLVFFILWTYFNKLVKEIKKISSTVDEKVEEKTKEFIDLNTELNLIFNNAADGIILIDINQIIQKVNDTYCELTGYSKKEIIGKKCHDFFPCNECNSPKCVLERIKKGERKIERDIINMPKRTGWFPCIQTSMPIKNNDGEIIGILENFKDITKRTIVEEQLRILSQAIQQSPVCVLITDSKGLIKFTNPSFSKITGYTIEEAMDKTPRILNSKKHDPLFYKNMWQTIKTGKEWRGEILNKKKNNELFWVSVSISPVKVQNGHIANFVAIMEDITERKKNEIELLRAKEKAEESDKLKTAFLANMSHEIRTPLNAIVGFSNILCDPSLEIVEKNNIYNHITENSEVLLKLIDDIIDISKIEAGEIKMCKEECSLNNICDELYGTFSKKINRANSFVRISVTKRKEDIIIHTDEHRLKQILTNLIENAFKFTISGFIEFGYAQRKQEILFYVLDTGIGIPGNQQKHVFKRFRQVDGSHNRLFGGTGLGLAITSNLISLLGGEIWMHSKEKEGTTFFFTTPYGYPTNVSFVKKNTLNIKKDFNWANKKIMVAEDVVANFDFIRAALRNTNAEIIWARDGIEAVNLFKAENNKIDLILMDINMPNMNGYEATKKIKTLNNSVPIIGQTAYAMIGEEKKCLAAGFDKYVSKPIQIHNLLSIIDEYMNNGSVEPISDKSTYA